MGLRIVSSLLFVLLGPAPAAGAGNWYGAEFRKLHLDFHLNPWVRDAAASVTLDEARRQMRMFKEAGVQSVEFFAYDYFGNALYPSDVMPRHPNLQQDYFGHMRQAARENGIHAVAYVNVFASVYLSAKHPDWFIVDKTGTKYAAAPLLTVDKSHICVLSPFLEQVYKPFLKELITRYSPDAIWLDGGSWLIETPCYCRFCRAKYHAYSGQEIPGQPRTATDDAAWQSWLRWVIWRRAQIRDYLTSVTSYIHQLRPEILIGDNNVGLSDRGYGAVMRKRFDLTMPEMMAWEIDTIDKLEKAEFDDPREPRRFLSAGDNQIAGVGDGFERNSPPWIETVRSLRPDFAVYGSMGEVSECLTRLIGQMNTLLWIGEYPKRIGATINRIGAHYLECAKAAIDAANGLLDGFVIFGDVAYKKSTFVSPAYWREYFKPWVKGMVAYAHNHGLPVIYHGCGNASAIFEDLIEIGVDGYHPLEAKAGLDALELRRRYGQRICFCGNSDIRVWETGDPAAIRREVLRKLNAARGGGYIFMSDHSVTSEVSGRTYDSIVKLVCQYGRYPLRLDEFDEGRSEA